MNVPILKLQDIHYVQSLMIIFFIFPFLRISIQHQSFKTFSEHLIVTILKKIYKTKTNSFPIWLFPKRNHEIIIDMVIARNLRMAWLRAECPWVGMAGETLTQEQELSVWVICKSSRATAACVTIGRTMEPDLQNLPQSQPTEMHQTSSPPSKKRSLKKHIK